MKSSFRIGSIAGIEIGIHYTWIFIFILIAWSLAEGFFPDAYPGWARGTYWITGIAASLLLFVSVLLHELAHSFVARARGMGVNSITLFIFGGVSNLEGEPERPTAEFAMAIVGPITSFILAGVFWGLAQAIDLNQERPAYAILSYLALINAILGGFNLIPGFPLDGGRVLRSIVWGISGNLVKATNIAGMVGQGFGWIMIGFGLFQLLAGNFLGGLWIAFIGWFLNSAADSSRREISIREQLSGIKVKDVMDPNPEIVAPRTSVADMIRATLFQRRKRAAGVVDNGRIVGIVTISDIKEVSQDEWAVTSVDKIMTGNPLYTVGPNDDLNTAMKLIAQHDLNQILVVSEGQLLGILTRADIIHYLQLSKELRIGGQSGRSPS